MFYLHLFHYIGFFGAQIANSILAFLLLKKAPKLFGAYRHVMLTFTVCSMWFSLVEILTQPVHYMKGPMFVVFLEHFNGWFGHVLACLHCGTFGCLVSMQTAQFFYRFSALCRPQSLKYLTGFRLFLIFLPCLIVYISWFQVVNWGMSATAEKREYIREDLELLYNIDSRTVSFIAALYWEVPVTVERIWRLKDVMASATCVFIIDSLCLMILFFALRIYFHMKNSSSQMSPKTLEMNRQLFVMLTLQTIIPFITMYIPIGLLIALPLLDLGLGSYSNYPSASISIYPLIEPLIAIWCIRDFRKTILALIRRKKESDVTVHPTGTSQTISMIPVVH